MIIDCPSTLFQELVVVSHKALFLVLLWMYKIEQKVLSVDTIA